MFQNLYHYNFKLRCIDTFNCGKRYHLLTELFLIIAGKFLCALRKEILKMARWPKIKKRSGKGAKVSCLAKYLHPSRLVSSTLPNTTVNSRLEECTVVGRDSNVVNRKEKAVIIVIMMISRLLMVSLKSCMHSQGGLKS